MIQNYCKYFSLKQHEMMMKCSESNQVLKAASRLHLVVLSPNKNEEGEEYLSQLDNDDDDDLRPWPQQKLLIDLELARLLSPP